VDYRRFLNRSEEAVAPVVGRYAWLADRRVRLEGEPRAGWWRVRVSGRSAEPVALATADEQAAALAPLVRLRGHAFRAPGGVALAYGGSGSLAVVLAPVDEDPPLLTPLAARRWPVGDLLLWEGLEWESEVEELARNRLEEGRGLEDVKGAGASLRAAFAFATVGAASRALDIPAEPVELTRWVRPIAEGGRPVAETALRALARERAAWRAVNAVPQPAAVLPEATSPDIEVRAEESLRGAGAYLTGLRRLGGGLIEARWAFLGHRFISVVEERGLRVVDSGVCLAGEDALVTLDSLPGVIREAIDEGSLVITRHEQGAGR
jgi:hypothetical protein